MQLEVGSIVEGKVTGITKFGAFIELPGGKTGMVHISEVASSYVKEISDHLSQNQMVKVKIIGITPEGKVSLSIKQVAPAQPVQQPASRPFNQNGPNAQGGERPQRPAFQRRPPREVSYGFDRRQAISSENMSFEDMMSKFKQTSEDKISDLKKYTDVKRGTSRNRNPQR
ncbi:MULTISPECIES: S1 RNA-binding domain-containing protein [Anaerotruncus]|jgi:S1 RNA binding domain protein|uniref:S1 RNA-binding domain-containing protein n=1 Tax=Anaerotruncus TaxID=244127 RepID=UPI000836D38C|nr:MULTISPECIES: S1 RNA-binding domain-containing protein [Anaerotruncus]RGX56645.1 RNA-binding protein S1 [Anaerotruncus sp. AF02-27]